MIRKILGALLSPYSARNKVDEIKEAQAEIYAPNRISPFEVEANVDRAGRERVFARAKALGWDGMLPPLWVWNQIAFEIIDENRKADEMKERQTARLQ